MDIFTLFLNKYTMYYQHVESIGKLFKHVLDLSVVNLGKYIEFALAQNQ